MLNRPRSGDAATSRVFSGRSATGRARTRAGRLGRAVAATGGAGSRSLRATGLRDGGADSSSARDGSLEWIRELLRDPALDDVAEFTEVRQHHRGGLVAIRRIFGHQLHHQPIDLQRQVGTMAQKAARDLAHVLQRQGHCRVGSERRLTGQHEIVRHAQRIEVASVVERVTLRLLGTHVKRCTHGHTGLRQVECLLALEATQAEVRHLHSTPLRDQNILGLHVPMDQPLLPGHTDRLRGLLHDRDGQRQVQRPLLPNIIPQVRPLDILHRDVMNLVDVPDRVDVHDIGVVETSNCRRFRMESV